MANAKKATIGQLDKMIARANKISTKHNNYLAYLIDFKAKYIQALNDGTVPPNGPKLPPGAGK